MKYIEQLNQKSRGYNTPSDKIISRIRIRVHGFIFNPNKFFNPPIPLFGKEGAGGSSF